MYAVMSIYCLEVPKNLTEITHQNCTLANTANRRNAALGVDTPNEHAHFRCKEFVSITVAMCETFRGFVGDAHSNSDVAA